MSRAWMRVSTVTLCGGPCGRAIQPGEPVMEIALTGIKARLRRCVRCAGEEPPPDLPLKMVTSEIGPRLKPMMRLVPAGGRDFKVAQSGDREPGDDDA